MLPTFSDLLRLGACIQQIRECSALLGPRFDLSWGTLRATQAHLKSPLFSETAISVQDPCLRMAMGSLLMGFLSFWVNNSLAINLHLAFDHIQMLERQHTLAKSSFFDESPISMTKRWWIHIFVLAWQFFTVQTCGAKKVGQFWRTKVAKTVLHLPIAISGGVSTCKHRMGSGVPTFLLMAIDTSGVSPVKSKAFACFAHVLWNVHNFTRHE